MSSTTAQQFFSQHQTRIAYLSFGLALVLICLASYFYLPQFAETFTGFYLYVPAVVLLFFVRRILPPLQTSAEDDVTSITRIRYWAIALSLFCFILLALINMPINVDSWIHVTFELIKSPTWVQMGLLTAGTVALAHGFGGRMLPRRVTWRTQYTLLLIIVVIGGLVRVIDIDQTYRLFVDEFAFVADIIYIREVNPPLLIPDNAPNTDVYSFFQHILTEIFEPSFSAIRIPSAVFCMGGLVAIYAFARELFSLRVALISALLFATMPVYIQFGRIGLNNIVDPIFGMLGFLYILRGMRSGQTSDYAMAGIMFGLTHYFYEGGRLFFTLFLVCWLVWIYLLARRDPLFRPMSRRQMLAFLFCFLVMILPIYHAFYHFHHPLTQRLNAMRASEPVAMERLREFMTHPEIGYLGTPLHQYVFYTSNDSFYQSDAGFVLPLLVPFFLLGFARVLWGLRTIHGSLLVWWMVGASISNGIIANRLSAESPRYLVVYGVLMIVAALGIHTLWGFIDERVCFRWRRYIKVGFLGYLLLVTVTNIQHYVDHVVPNLYGEVYGENFPGVRPLPALDDMILRAVELPDNTTVIVISDFLVAQTYEIFIPLYYRRTPHEYDLDVKGHFADTITPEFFATLPRDTNYVFAFTRYHQDRIVPMIEAEFNITKIEGSRYNIPDEAEVIFIHAPLFVNPALDGA